MNIKDCIKEIRRLASEQGDFSRKEINDIIYMTLNKILKLPGLGNHYKLFNLQNIDNDDSSFNFCNNDMHRTYFSIKNDDSVERVYERYEYSSKNYLLKTSELAEQEKKFFNILKDSDSFKDLINKLNEHYIKDVNQKYLDISSNADRTLAYAVQSINNIESGDNNYFKMDIEPFSSLLCNSSRIATFLNKNIEDKLEYLKQDTLIFDSLINYDGVSYTSVEKFIESYKEKKINENHLASKLLSDDNPLNCIMNVFDDEWFKKNKEICLNSIKKSLMEPTIDEIYSEYPFIDNIIEKICDSNPQFNIDINNMTTIKILSENKNTSIEEINMNKKEFLNDYNKFTFNENEDKYRDGEEKKYTRLYMTTPLKVLIDIGGEHRNSENEDVSLLFLNEIDKNDNISNENELLCINKFMEHCSKNKIVCIYDSDEFSDLFLSTLKDYKGKVVLVNQNENTSSLMAYNIMIKEMKLCYKDILKLESDVREIKEDTKKNEIIEFLSAKLKDINKFNQKPI